MYGNSALLSVDNPAITNGFNDAGMFPNGVKITYSLPDRIEGSFFNSLVTLNDYGFTFKQIADVLEALYTNADD